MQFLYQAIRLWELPVEAIMAGGLGTLPLAPLCKVAEVELPHVISRMEQRIRVEAHAAELPALWTSTYILMGLRYPPEVAAHLLRGVRDMKESSTYQAILDEGSMAEARRLLLLQGTERFGPPDIQTRRAIERARSISRLEKLVLRLLTVSSWQELLSPPRQ